ncbi:MAG TPA: serine/threonine-protein kinase, partial [Kofleriaceae bacterium]
MQPSPEPIAPDHFGPYEVYERLGLGGMATVCRAKKRGPAGFERSVALKRMLSHLSEDQTFVESFIREAKVSSLLVHPNIAQVYDFGRINGTYYIAMELVPGFDLRKLLRYANRANESIPLAVVLSILGEMCDALEYAHNCLDEQGTALRIVHRDISPSNIIVAHTGHTKVIDFGIAKANSRQLHTESGQVKGKLGYMSPEAALGMQIGPVSDVFSMGVVAWELVTASPLFSARSDFETMRKIREAEVQPPSTHNPACPPDLDRLIMSALVRQDQHRLASASQFRSGLDAVAAREGIHVGSRAVAEWMRQFIQPDDFARSSGFGARSVPQEAPTSVLRPSQRSALQRSHDEIALAAEIWGEDAGPNSVAAGPDFSIENPRADPGASTTTPMKAVAIPTANYVTPSR